jgi:hypothetical protein
MLQLQVAGGRKIPSNQLSGLQARERGAAEKKSQRTPKTKA